MDAFKDVIAETEVLKPAPALLPGQLSLPAFIPPDLITAIKPP